MVGPFVVQLGAVDAGLVLYRLFTPKMLACPPDAGVAAIPIATGRRGHIENKFGWVALAAAGIGLGGEATCSGQLRTVDLRAGAIVKRIIVCAVTPNVYFFSSNSKQKSIDIERRIRGRGDHIVVDEAAEWTGRYPRPAWNERVRPHVAPAGYRKAAGGGQPLTAALIRHVH